jgi:hypothetical protein
MLLAIAATYIPLYRASKFKDLLPLLKYCDGSFVNDNRMSVFLHLICHIVPSLKHDERIAQNTPNKSHNTIVVRSK